MAWQSESGTGSLSPAKRAYAHTGEDAGTEATHFQPMNPRDRAAACSTLGRKVTRAPAPIAVLPLSARMTHSRDAGNRHGGCQSGPPAHPSAVRPLLHSAAPCLGES